MIDHAFDLMRVAVRRPKGERMVDPDELPGTIDSLMALRTDLMEVSSAIGEIRREVEVKVASILGPGQTYVYGPDRLRWTHPWKWRVYRSAIEKFVGDAAAADPANVLELFNPNSIRKTGIEKVAKRLGVDPDLAVRTLMYREHEPEPRLEIKPVALDPIGGSDANPDPDA